MKRLTLVLFILVMLCLPVLAQEATAEATDTAPVIVNVEPTPTANDGSIWGLVLIVGGGFVAVIGAISFGLQALGNRAAQAAANPLVVEALEKAHDSIPASVLQTIIEPLKASLERSDDALRKMIDLYNKVSDSVPESQKPSAAGTGETDATLRKSETEGLSTPPTTYRLGDPLGSMGSSFTSTPTGNMPPSVPFGG